VFDVETVDAHRTWGALDLFAAAGEVVQATTANLEGADHRRDLLEVADEAAGDVVELGAGDRHRLAVEDRAGRVEGAGRDAEDHVTSVRLASFREETQQAGDTSEAHEQDTGGVGVEGAGVADASLPIDVAEPRDDVVGRAAARLVDNDKSVAHRRRG
jgi:hypothetical protein